MEKDYRVVELFFDGTVNKTIEVHLDGMVFTYTPMTSAVRYLTQLLKCDNREALRYLKSLPQIDAKGR